MRDILIAGLSLLVFGVCAQDAAKWKGKMEQLGSMLPTPNEYRTASGAPGPEYWQQRADYVIDIQLDDDLQRIAGTEQITYHNNSPSSLDFIWLQLDQNILAPDNLTIRSQTNSVRNGTTARDFARSTDLLQPPGGFRVASVKTTTGQPLACTINHTMMRVELPESLEPGKQFVFLVDWSYDIGNRMIDGQRSGMEYFEEDGNYVYTIAQFFPRMCAYNDHEGWQNKQYLGGGEFALPFGNYRVRITVPGDHIVAATGKLTNPDDVLSGAQIERMRRAMESYDKPVVIVTEEEAIQAEKGRSTTTKTWEFEAENVRDFAFASSRKFIWDAMAVRIGNHNPLAMSFYPKEGNPLWELESTRAIKNTLVTYSKYTFDYPYPVAIAVHTADIGMEYPMICFNYGRPVRGVYSDRTKFRMIGVIIHEIGHNFFPMIVNTDERQWVWMDEGINSFLQFRTETEQYDSFPHRRGPAELLIPYMKGENSSRRPLMTNAEQVILRGSEQYAKCATALNILREVVMGPDLFDFSLREFARRWAFKHPEPADFFRTMEDASGVDLDWFWRGWFYSTDNVDISIDSVKWYRLDEGKAQMTADIVANGMGVLSKPAPFHVIPTDQRFYGEFRSRVNDSAFIDKLAGKNIYEVQFSNRGGLIMPLIVKWNYVDGGSDIDKIPAEIWRTDESHVTKVFVKDKEIVSVSIDPEQGTTDINIENNRFPRQAAERKFDTYKKRLTH